MPKYRVIIEEIIVGEIEVEAKDVDEVKFLVRGYREEAGETIKPLETIQMNGQIITDDERHISFLIM